jgi:hypothetical protein
VASTLVKVRRAVRFRLRDFVVSKQAISTIELNEIIQSNTRYVSGCIPLGEKWVSGASGIVVTAGSDTSTLPSGVEYTDVLELRRTVDGYILKKRTREEMNLMFWTKHITSTKEHAEPTDYCLMENEAQSVAIRFQSPALTTTTIDLLRRVLPSDLIADTTEIPFSTLAIEAITDLSSFEALAKLPPVVLEEKKLNPSVGSLWGKRAEDNIRHETERLHKLRGVGRKLGVV